MIRPDIRAKHASTKHSSAKDVWCDRAGIVMCNPHKPTLDPPICKVTTFFFLLKPHKPTPVS